MDDAEIGNMGAAQMASRPHGFKDQGLK